MPWGAAAAVAGAYISSEASGDAADSQTASADKADATQRYQYDTTRADNAPFRETGLAANNKLAYLMGIGGSDTSLGNTTGEWTPNSQLYANDPVYKKAWDGFMAEHRAKYGINPNSERDSISSALANGLAGHGYTQPSSSGATGSDYGSLLKNYGQSDAENDYIYQTQKQFGLDEGTKGLNRIAAASGSMLSGAAAKALTRFGNDYAGTKLGESYNRFENNKTGTYNKLAGISGAGQQATNQINAAGQNMANNISANQIGLGNARGASAIAQGNAISGAIGQGFNAYQQNQLMRQPQQPAYFGSGGMGGFGDSYSTSYGE